MVVIIILVRWGGERRRRERKASAFKDDSDSEGGKRRVAKRKKTGIGKNAFTSEAAVIGINNPTLVSQRGMQLQHAVVPVVVPLGILMIIVSY